VNGFNDLAGLEGLRFGGHGGRLGIVFHARGNKWAELALPYDAALVGDPASVMIGPDAIITLMDMATSFAVWIKRGGFVPHATLDLRVDYLRPARPDQTVIGRGECYRLTRSIAFVRGQAHDGDPADPIAHVAGTYLNLDAPA
jgi:uncharacterized protein (TIGR00369 family)